MAANFNKVFLMGNLTRDPQLSYLPSNTPVVELGMAVNRRFRRQDGEQGEETLFIDCRAFGRTAEVINQYCAKGRPLFVEGRLQLDRWQDKEGNSRSKHRIFIENFQFIDQRGGAEAPGPEAGGAAPAPGGGGGGSAPAPPPSNAGPPPGAEPDPEGDDIPF
jgi:single-strand DNA-binding protein